MNFDRVRRHFFFFFASCRLCYIFAGLRAGFVQLSKQPSSHTTTTNHTTITTHNPTHRSSRARGSGSARGAQRVEGIVETRLWLALAGAHQSVRCATAAASSSSRSSFAAAALHNSYIVRRQRCVKRGRRRGTAVAEGKIPCLFSWGADGRHGVVALFNSLRCWLHTT